MTEQNRVQQRVIRHFVNSDRALVTQINGDTRHVRKILKNLNETHKAELLGIFGDGMALIKIERRYVKVDGEYVKNASNRK